MSESSGEQARIDDEQLPDDLVAGDDNPLAEPLDADEDAGDLLTEGKTATESEGGSEGGSEQESEPGASDNA